MTSVTVSLPDETYRRLDEIARSRGTSIDRLFDEMAALMVAESDAEARFLEKAALMLAESDAEARFRARARRGQGKAERGLGLLSQAAGPRGEGRDRERDLDP